MILAVIKQRNIKTEEEIEQLHIATTLTSRMHRTVMEHAQSGMFEYEIKSKAAQVVYGHNASWSFTPIVTKNGHILHNHNYGNRINDGDLLLFDGGIEAPSGYAGDMTRTIPVSGKYTDKQKDVYNIVVSAHKKALAACKPGVYYKDVHMLSAQIIADGLTNLGIMKGDPEAAVDEGAHTLFFQHGLGHMIGLDVHDMENLGEDFVGYDETIRRSEKFGTRSLRLGRPLEKGHAITIEPGIYFIPQLIDNWKAENKLSDFINYDVLENYKNFGGIRLENDYYIDDSKAVLLGEELPFDANGVEGIRSSHS